MDGTQPLISLVDECVEGDDDERIVNRIRTGLCELINSGTVALPPRVLECCGDHYARRLIHRDDVRGYSIIAMTWGPHQGTSLHDHGGMWCVEGVWQGEIEVQQYELVEKHHERFRFERRGSFQAGIGSAGCLIPPHEYHLIRNPGNSTAVSMHIYGGDMTRVGVFEPTSDGWYLRQEKALGLDL